MIQIRLIVSDMMCNDMGRLRQTIIRSMDRENLIFFNRIRRTSWGLSNFKAEIVDVRRTGRGGPLEGMCESTGSWSIEYDR